MDAVSDLNISRIKREKLDKERKKLKKEQLRSGLPILTAKDIRKFRLPYHEAILADLNEAGHEDSAQFIEQLIEFQEENRQKSGPSTPLWLRPQLKYSNKNLDILSRGLSKAETARIEGDLSLEWDEILHLATHYAFGNDDWWWLGEQLLFQCISIHYTGDFKKNQATSYYILGKYLLENAKKLELARFYLEEAREVSLGKSWNCKKFLKGKHETIFIEACHLLYITLIEQATQAMKTDPAKAVEICTLARKRAAESCDHESEYQALILKGKCELLLGESGSAIATLSKALSITVRRHYVEGTCQSKIQLGLAYLQHNKPEEALAVLKGIKKLAEQNNMPFYVGQSYRYMGEYYLNQGKHNLATPLLIMAFYIFHDNHVLGSREEVRTLAAISAGEELFPTYVEIIKNSTRGENAAENLMKLLRWKDERVVFWEQRVSKFSFFCDSSVSTIEEVRKQHQDSIVEEDGPEEEIANTRYEDKLG